MIAPVDGGRRRQQLTLTTGKMVCYLFAIVEGWYIEGAGDNSVREMSTAIAGPYLVPGRRFIGCVDESIVNCRVPFGVKELVCWLGWL